MCELAARAPAADDGPSAVIESLETAPTVDVQVWTTDDATVILCYSGGGDVREITDVTVDDDPIPGLRDHFARRLDHARSLGAERLVIDPGMGFYYGNLTDPLTRARHQARVLLNGIRLRDLGVPLCNALPHAFDLFEEHFRSAESFFAVLAVLGGTGILRTHEVPQVRAVVSAMSTLSVN